MDFALQNLHVVTATQVVTPSEVTGRVAMMPDGNMEYPAILPICIEMQPTGSFSEPEMTTSKLCLDMHRHTAFPDTAASLLKHSFVTRSLRWELQTQTQRQSWERPFLMCVKRWRGDRGRERSEREGYAVLL